MYPIQRDERVSQLIRRYTVVLIRRSHATPGVPRFRLRAVTMSMTCDFTIATIVECLPDPTAAARAKTIGVAGIRVMHHMLPHGHSAPASER